MQFGEVPVGEAEGAILVHSLRFGKTALKKGRILSADDLREIVAAGLDEITVVRLDSGDIREDPAAERIAVSVAGAGIVGAPAFTGRANLFAERKGLLVFERDRLDRLNQVDEAVTLGTLPPYAVVEPQQMVATVKIIPFAMPEASVARCAEIAAEGGKLLSVVAFHALSVGMVQTRLPGLKETILDKTREVTEGRLAALGCRLALERRCAHKSGELAREIEAAIGDVDMLLIHGASAIADRRDVIPAAIETAGGTIEHFGMPVDPGNLLLLGHVNGKPVLGLPGCARSPKVNGFDWVLERLVAGLPVGPKEIMSMGAGGLLAEIPVRGLKRAEAGAAPAASPDAKPLAKVLRVNGPVGPRIAALLLAAGKSSRMGANKMLEEIDGQPMVGRTAQRLLASRARPIIAVIGNQAEAVDAALGRLPVERVMNPDFAEGLSTSLIRGLAALPADVEGVVVCLGDMPLIAGRDIDRLIAAFNPLEGRAIIVPIRRGRRGNPILWSRQFFREMMALKGDQGARKLIEKHAEFVVEIEMDSDAVLIDIDTPEALAQLRERVKPSAA
ncbi:MAG TPA: molybdopterin-binding/glycosyltransferase family 2 protein [Stellaceae bacterium]|nr:molybdopterin-binding/glycosyltransferase family 2 protein [Stellaceae bacterium]